MMNVVDISILLLLLVGCIAGWKKGFIKSLVTLIGTMAVIVISYQLKTPIASFLLKNMPFFNFSGIFEGITSINILVYEVLSFIVVFVILYCILGIIINISGIIEKILNATILLGIFSKILGAIAGLLEMLAFVFVLLFAMAQFNLSSELVLESKIGSVILNQTPILTNVCAPMIRSVEDIYTLVKESDGFSKEFINLQAASKLCSYGVITQKDLDMLLDSGKLGLEGATINMGD